MKKVAGNLLLILFCAQALPVREWVKTGLKLSLSVAEKANEDSDGVPGDDDQEPFSQKAQAVLFTLGFSHNSDLFIPAAIRYPADRDVPLPASKGLEPLAPPPDAGA